MRVSGQHFQNSRKDSWSSRAAKNSWFACLTFRKLSSSSFQKLAAPLPLNRLKKVQAFNVTGVDFGGPLSCKKTQLIKNPMSITCQKTVITIYISAMCVNLPVPSRELFIWSRFLIFLLAPFYSLFNDSPQEEDQYLPCTLTMLRLSVVSIFI